MGGLIAIPEEQQSFIDAIVEKVETWMASGLAEEPICYLERCNPFQRKLIYQTLKSKFGGDLYLEAVVKGKDKVIAVTKVL